MQGYRVATFILQNEGFGSGTDETRTRDLCHAESAWGVRCCSPGLASVGVRLVSTDNDMTGRVGGGPRGVGRPLATAQGVENVLGSPVLAFGESLAYLAYDRPRHPIRFEPANELFLAYRELDALQVALHVLSRAGGKVLPQKVHGFGLASSTRSVSALRLCAPDDTTDALVVCSHMSKCML